MKKKLENMGNYTFNQSKATLIALRRIVIHNNAGFEPLRWELNHAATGSQHNV